MKNFIPLILSLGICLSSCKNQIAEISKYSINTSNGSIETEVPGYFKNIDTLHFSKTKSDTFRINLYFSETEIELKLKTDIDSLKIPLLRNKENIINIEKSEMMPIILIAKNGIDTKVIEFDPISENKNITIKYENDTNKPYFQELRNKYPIDSIVSDANTDFDKVKKISSWVHNLWEHDGANEPEKYDALYILDEVKKGRRFRCVEYGLVTTTCLNALGINARVLALKTEDVETRYSGAGHVLLEVFLKDLDKWIMVDPQWNVIPLLENVPLNAVELQSAVTKGKDVKLWTSGNNGADMYISWIYPYLYYFSVSFDNRENIKERKHMYQGKRDLMLVPQGAKNPTVFQQRFPIDYVIYTHSLKDFYSKPD